MRFVKLTVFIGAIVAISSLTALLHGQAGRPRVSPHESTNATIDGSDITITYGRPSMRGRAIVGRLVPYGRVWCPGADEATTLDSTRELRIGDLTIPAGPHTIWMLPTADTWTLVVSKEPSGFHTNYNASADLGRLEMTKRTVETPVEQLTFAIVTHPMASAIPKSPTTATGGLITMTWETTEVSVPFTVQ